MFFVYNDLVFAEQAGACEPHSPGSFKTCYRMGRVFHLRRLRWTGGNKSWRSSTFISRAAPWSMGHEYRVIAPTSGSKTAASRKSADGCPVLLEPRSGYEFGAVPGLF